MRNPPSVDSARSARLIGIPNPFSAKVVEGWCPAGLTLRQAVAQLCAAHGIPPGWARHAHIWVNGRKASRHSWDETKIEPGQLLNFRIVPAGGGGGGGGKNPLRTVMSIAVMAASWYFAPEMLAALGGKAMAANAGLAMGIGVGGGLTLGAAVVGGVMSIAGGALVDAIAPVSNSQSSSSSSSLETDDTGTAYSISGSSNSARKYEPLPIPLGRVRRPADHAALPYSEASGSDQWGHYLFMWGLSPLKVRKLKLGETDLDVFLKSSTRDLLPEMEAATTGSTTISASADSATAWKLGNNSRDTASSYWSTSAALPADIFFDLGSIRGVQGYTLRPQASYLANMATAWELAWSEDGVNYTTLDTKTGQTWPDATKKSIELPAVQQARYLRLRITAAGSATLIMDEAEILGGLLIETHEGREGEAPFTLYTGNTHEESIGAQLPWEDNETQEFTIRYTQAGCTGFELEDYFDQGLWRLQPGGTRGYGVSVTSQNEYRLKGSSDEWKRVGAQADAGWVVQVADVNVYADRRACRFTLSSGELAAGQYEIRRRRIARDVGNSNTEDGTIWDRMYWSVLRTFRPGEPVTLTKPWAGSALCVQANEDFSGTLPVLSAEVSSICPDWDKDTQTWITRETSNPASLYRYWLQHPCRINPVADAKIDLTTLEIWHEFCEENGLTFNGEAVIRGKSIRAVLRQICAAGRGSLLQPNGVWSVVWDAPQDEIAYFYNDRNMWNFKCDRAFAQIPHGLRVVFNDEDNDFQEDEFTVYDDGYDASNATIFERISFDGVTSHAANFKLARHHLAQLRLRPFRYSWESGLEWIIAHRGRLVSLTASDIKAGGLVSARVKSVTYSEVEEEGEEPEFALGVKLDQACGMEAGKSYGLEYRRKDGKVCVQSVDFVEFETQELTFTEPVPYLLAPQEDNLCTFGLSGQTSITGVVLKIQPGAENTATLTAWDYSPEIFDASTGPVPAWNPHITQPIYAKKVATPVIQAIRSGEEAILVNADGTLTIRAEVAFTIPSGAPVAASTVEIQHRPSVSSQWSDSITSPVGVGAMYITGLEEGAAYEFRARAVATAGLASAWTAATAHTIVGKSSPPPNVPWLLAQVSGDVVTSRWGSVSVVDLHGYTMRAAPKGVFDWSTASEITTAEAGTLLATADLSPGEWTLGIKAKDTSGNESVTAATCDVVVTTTNWSIAARQQHPSWPGGFSGLIKDDLTGLLVPLSQSTLNDIAELSQTWGTNPVTSASYESPEIDTGSERSMRLWADLRGLVSPGSALGVSDSDLSMEVSSREEGGEYGDWARWSIGDLAARYVKFRAVWNPATCPLALQVFTTNVDAPTRVEEDQIDVPAGGTSVAFATPFASPPTLEVYNASGLVRFPVYATPTASGFDLDVYDVSETSVGGATRYKAIGV